MEDVRDWGRKVQREIAKTIVGQEKEIRDLLVCALSDDHPLLEGVPGIAKTMLLRTLATTFGGEFARIQFTPDLMPSDITGTDKLDGGKLTFQEGPIFANVVLGDEINRTPPKTQAAMLEAMQERQVTVSGKTRSLPTPFMVVATQNPLEYEGTYPLPEAQIDRFMMRIVMGYPSAEEELEVAERHSRKHQRPHVEQVSSPEELMLLQKAVESVYVDPLIGRYIVDIVRATRDPAGSNLSDLVSYIKLGASPRAAISLYKASRALAALQGREYVLPEDVFSIAPSILNHRLILNPFEMKSNDRNALELSQEIVGRIPTPDIAEQQLEKARLNRTHN